MTEPKHYTAEVEEALKAYRPAPPEPVGSPPGYLRYHFVIEETVTSGIASISTVAATLRQLADQIESTEGAQHG